MVQCIGKTDEELIGGLNHLPYLLPISASMAVIKDFFFSSDHKNEIIVLEKLFTMSMDTENDSP